MVNLEAFNGTTLILPADFTVTDGAIEFVESARNFLFAYLTPLELLYPTAAKCSDGGLDVR